MSTLLAVLSLGAVWLAVALVLGVWVGRAFSGSWFERAWMED